MANEHDMAQYLADMFVDTIFSSSQKQKYRLDINICHYAAKYHRIAPLLHILSKKENIELDDDADEFLQKSFRHAAIFVAQQRQVRQNVSQIFTKEGISFLELKGRGFAKQLYVQPTARFSKDIDIIIKPQDRGKAISILSEAGYLHSAEGRKLSSIKAKMDMWSLKDTMVFDPNFGQQIELHQRLFLTEPNGLSSDFFRALTLKSPNDNIPNINDSFYIFYLIMHGALTHWPSLKWAIDLVLLLQKTEAEKASDVFNLARRYHCVNAISASINFASNLFPKIIPKHWEALAIQNKTPKSIKLRNSYQKIIFGGHNNVKRLGYPVSEWYIYDGGINYFDEVPRKSLRRLIKTL